jgi:hypothetical protein
MSNSLKLPNSPKVKRTTFKGNAIYNLSVLKYLKKKYKQYCVIIPKINKTTNLVHRDVSLRWVQENEKEGYFSIPNNYWNYFIKCDKKRFIVFPFGFDCSNFMGHANYMVYDRETASLERFEPYGKTHRTCTNPNRLDEKIKKLFNDNLGKDFVKNYYKPLDFMPLKSFQRIQESEKQNRPDDPPGGFCSAWSCWYAELRLSNPNIDRKKIIKYAFEKLDNDGISLTEYIRNYSSLIAKSKLKK